MWRAVTRVPPPAPHALTVTVLHMLSFLKSGNKPGANWSQRLKQGLARTRELLNRDLSDLFGSGKIDEQFYEELERRSLPPMSA